MMKKLCPQKTLEELQRLHVGASLSDAFLEMDNETGASSWEGPLRGRVIGIDFEVPPAAYEVECFEYGCFDTAGVWTFAPIDTVPPWYTDGAYTAYQPGCFSPECFAPFRYTCELYVPMERALCFEEAAYEHGAYELDSVYVPSYIMAPDGNPCFPPTSSLQGELPPPHRGEEYWWGTCRATIYRSLEGMTFLFPPYGAGAQEPDVYESQTFISPPGDWLVCEASAYELGAFEPNAFEDSIFFLFREPELERCFEDCAFSTWQLVGIYHCTLPLDPQTYPQLVISRETPPLTWEERILLGLPGPVEVMEGVTLYSSYSSPYEEGAYGEGSYGTYLFIWADYPPLEDGAYEDGVYNPLPLLLLDMEGNRLVRIYVPQRFEFAVARLEYCYHNCPLPALHERSCYYDIDPYGASALLRAIRPCLPTVPPILGGCACSSPPPEEYGGRFAHRWFWDGSTWKSQWFVPGWGTKETAYVVDVGYTYFCWDELIVEEFVPLRVGGTFLSREILQARPKYARLMRVNLYSVEKVAESWGYFPLPRQEFSSLQGSLGGETIVKEIALGAIRLLMSDCAPMEECQYEWGVSPPYFLPYVSDILSALLGLISMEGGIGKGSIPARLYQGSTYRSLYGERDVCPAPYVKGAFMGGCLDEPFWDEDYMVDDDGEYCSMDCFESEKLIPRLSLYVETETVAWVVLAACILSELSPSFKTTWATTIQTSLLFLRRAREGSPSGLVRDSLVMDTWGSGHSLSSSVVTLLAFSKGYDLFGDPWMVETAARLHQALLDGLYAPSLRMYATSYEEQIPAGYLYGLLHSLLYVRSEATESCLSVIAAHGKLHQNTIRPIKGMGLYTAVRPSSMGRYPLLSGGGDFEYSLLVLSLRGAVANNFKNPVEPLLRRRDQQVYAPTFSSLVAILSPGATISHEIFQPRCVGEIERILLYYQLSYNKLTAMWPTDFSSWASSSAVKAGGNISKVLRAGAAGLSTWYAILRTRTLGVYAGEAGGSLLDRWGEDLNLPRRPGEYDSLYRKRVLSMLGGRCDSYEDAIEAKVLSWGYETPEVIEYPAQSTPSWKRPTAYDPRVGIPLLHGGKSLRPSYEVALYGVLSEPDLQRIDLSRAGGVVGYYRDRIALLSECSPPGVYDDIALTRMGGATPRGVVEDLCCTAGCYTLLRLRINGPFSDAVYLWFDGDYRVGFVIPDGQIPLAVVGAGETTIVTLVPKRRSSP